MSNQMILIRLCPQWILTRRLVLAARYLIQLSSSANACTFPSFEQCALKLPLSQKTEKTYYRHTLSCISIKAIALPEPGLPRGHCPSPLVLG